MEAEKEVAVEEGRDGERQVVEDDDEEIVVLSVLCVRRRFLGGVWEGVALVWLCVVLLTLLLLELLLLLLLSTDLLRSSATPSLRTKYCVIHTNILDLSHARVTYFRIFFPSFAYFRFLLDQKMY